MSRRLMPVLAVVLVLLLATSAMATNARINSFGGGVKHFTILDDRNIYFLPAELVKYGNWASLELGNWYEYTKDVDMEDPDDNYTSFAFHYNLTEDTVVGFSGNSMEVPALDFPEVNQGGSFANWGDRGQTHKGTLYLGHGDMEQRFGLRVGFYGDKDERIDDRDDPTSSYNRGPSIMDIGAGAGFELNSGQLDIGVGYMKGKAKDEGQETEDGSENDQTKFSVLLRGTFPKGDEGDTWIPYASFTTTSADGQENADDSFLAEGKFSMMMFGADLHLHLTDNIFIQPGAGFSFGSAKETWTGGDPEIVAEWKDTMSVIPFFNLACDVKVKDWLDIRFGGAQYIASIKEESNVDGDPNPDDPFTYKHTEISHMLATGVAFNLPNEVTIDLQVHNGWWMNGPYFLTGDDTFGFGLNGSITKDW